MFVLLLVTCCYFQPRDRSEPAQQPEQGCKRNDFGSIIDPSESYHQARLQVNTAKNQKEDLGIKTMTESHVNGF